MPKLARVPAGSFCWVEHTSKDPRAATAFYSEVFGWSISDQPMPNGSTYTLAKVGAETVAGFFKMKVPAPFWLAYVAVDDLNAAAASAAAAGGSVIRPPTDVGIGRLAILEDPSRSMFALWQVQQQREPWLYAEDGALAWNELSTTDVERARRFYTDVFGWRADVAKVGSTEHTVFKRGDVPVSGVARGPATGWASYFQVGSADETVDRAKRQGAALLNGVAHAPGVGRWALLQDPQGAAFGVLQSSR